MRSLCRATSIITVAVLGAGLGLAGCSEDIPAAQLGSSAEELTATTTFQSGVNGVVDDTFISASDMRTNFGNDKRLRISAQNEGLIRFDLSSIPANAVINKAELTLYVNGGEDERDDDCRDGDHEGNSIAPLKIHRVTAAWAEGAVTYRSFDQAFDSAVAATMILSSRHTYKTLDLKSLVQSWVAGSKPNYGVAITTAGRAHTLIVSSEQNPVSQRPALKITYTTPDDHCSPNRCQHGGTCNNNSNGYTCTCPAGYAGRDCQVDINECAGNPCRHGGQCTDQVDGYSCTCGDGWGGANCQTDIDECDADPCQNGGVCTEVEQQSCGGHGWRHRGHNSGLHHGHHGHGGGDDADDDDNDNDDADYTCACPPGFSGANCEVDIDDCAGNPCGANGTCTDGASGYTCTCATGYSGPACATNVDDCAASACQNGGTCVDGVGTYTCSCPAGFDGPLCANDIEDCTANSCLNGGVCTDLVNGYSCACPAGITGTHCEIDIDECAGNPCGANGTCNDLLAAYSCSCAPGYTGTLCEINVDECAGSPCQNGGACVDGVNSYTCTCAAGFQGLTCADDIDECAANPCVHGACNDLVAGYTCACQAGYSGINCDINIDDCGANACSGHGTCTDGVDSHGCVCDGFYSGADCQIAPCGNGLVQGAEQCDDGNTVDGDGCSSTCTLEGCSLALPPNPTGLVGRWTFDDLTDSTGHFGDLTLQGNATIANGKLDVNAAGNPAEATGWAVSGAYLGATIRAKTLVAWVSLDDLAVQSGSALSLDGITDDNFDGVVYGERVAGRWMSGSSAWLRTQDVVASAEPAVHRLIQMAISYRDTASGNVEITICRDGVQIGQYIDSPMAQWSSGNAEVVFGKRHTFSGAAPRGGIDAHIDEARIYDSALACGQVCASP